MINRFALIIAIILLGGCATSSTSQGESVTINGVPEATRTEIQGLLDAWPQGDKSKIITELEKLSPEFHSPDGAWEIAINSAIALAYIESGDVQNFKMAVHTLRQYVQPQKRLPRLTQYVLAVDDAISGKSSGDEMMIEYRISGVAQSLLGNQSTGGHQ